MKKTEYALYKGENLLDIGTLDELQKKYKVKRETLYFYQSPAHRKRERKHVCLERIKYIFPC